MCLVVWILFFFRAVVLDVEKWVALGDGKRTWQDPRDNRMMYD